MAALEDVVGNGKSVYHSPNALRACARVYIMMCLLNGSLGLHVHFQMRFHYRALERSRLR